MREPDTSLQPQVDVAALYARYHQRLHRQAAYVLPQHLQDEAGAAVMTVVTRLVSRNRDGHLAEPAKGWEPYLVQAVTNACLDVMKARREHDELDPEAPYAERDAPRDPTGDTVCERLDRTEAAMRVRAALETLDPRLRAVVAAKFFHEKSNKIIGGELGLTPQRVGQLYTQALKELREELTRDD